MITFVTRNSKECKFLEAAMRVFNRHAKSIFKENNAKVFLGEDKVVNIRTDVRVILYEPEWVKVDGGALRCKVGIYLFLVESSFHDCVELE